MNMIQLVICFILCGFIGFGIGYFAKKYIIPPYCGKIVITYDEDGLALWRLVINDPPETLEGRKYLTFKVVRKYDNDTNSME